MSANSCMETSPRARFLVPDEFSHVLSFLSPKELAGAESVCRSWRRFIDKTHQWEKQCQVQLNTSEDPMTYLPSGSRSHKEGLRTVLSRVLAEDKYRYYLGAKVAPASRIPEAISLRRFNEPDSCDRTRTIGQEYSWMYSPPYFEITVDENSPLDLDKPDDPNDEEAPRLIQREAEVVERSWRLVELGTESEKRVLKVPNTINNLRELFKHPQNGHPSDYEFIWPKITEQHGNKRIPSGWVCMREGVIGRNQTYAQQKAIANGAEVVIPQFGHRILFDLLKHAETNVYPDGHNPLTFARTLTLTRDSDGDDWPSSCGDGGPSGLHVSNHHCHVADPRVGVAVALPVEVQASGP